MMKRVRHPGNTLSEYGLLIGTLSVLCIGGVTMLGGSISDLLLLTAGLPGLGTGESSDSNTSEDGLGVSLDSSKTNLSQLGFISGQGTAGDSGLLSPNQAANSYNMLTGTGGVSVNVTSVEGNDRSVMGTIRLAAYLEQLAMQEPNPENKAYYAKLAKLSYYIGANEGELDDFEGYRQGKAYNNAFALNDMITKQAELKQMLNNPPTTLQADKLAHMTPMVDEVIQIAQKYKNSLSSVIGPNGLANYTFSIKTRTDYTNTVGSGSTLGDIQLEKNNPLSPNTVTYEDLMAYDQLKSTVKTTLVQYPVTVQAPEVVETFRNTTDVDQAAN